MKILYTEEMMKAPIGEVFYKIDWKKHKGCDQRDWQKYRIIKKTQGSEVWYTIEVVALEGYISLVPRFLGGRGFFYSKVRWDEGCELHSFFGVKYPIYEEAHNEVISTLEWLEKIYSPEVKVKSEVISWL